MLTDCRLCWLTVTYSDWLSLMLTATYADCDLCWLTVTFADCHLCRLSLMLTVTYADCHLCWLSLMLTVTYADCHICWLSLMPTVTYADCHLCWLSLKLFITFADCHLWAPNNECLGTFKVVGVSVDETVSWQNDSAPSKIHSYPSAAGFGSTTTFASLVAASEALPSPGTEASIFSTFSADVTSVSGFTSALSPSGPTWCLAALGSYKMCGVFH